MSKQTSVQLGKIKAQFNRIPLPDKFSRIVSVILGYTNRDTYQCWPSKKRIAREVGCSEKTVTRNLQAVKELGLFSVRTLGRTEMRQILGDKFKSGGNGQRLYSLYQLNEDHPLWKGEGVEETIEIIRKATHAGISTRTRKDQKPVPEVPKEPSLIGIDPFADSCFELSQIGTVPSIQIGTAPSHQIGTVPTLLNGDGAVPGTF